MPPTALLYLLRFRINLLIEAFPKNPLGDFSNHFFDAGLLKRTKKELPNNYRESLIKKIIKKSLKRFLRKTFYRKFVLSRRRHKHSRRGYISN